MAFSIILFIVLIFVDVVELRCMPKTYEGYEIKFSTLQNGTSKPSVTAVTRNIAYDAINFRIAINGSSSSSYEDDKIKGLPRTGTSYFSVIQFFKNQTQYSISNGTCTKTKLPSQFIEDCLPRNATKIQQCSSGTATYYITASGAKATWVMDQHDFIIKRRTESGYKDYQVKDITQLKNYRVGIRDRSVFQLPRICDRAQSTKPLDIDLSHTFG